MRKSILLILLVLAVFFSINVYATDYEEKKLGIKDENIATILNNQIGTNEYAKINDKRLYADSLCNFALNDRPVIKIYNEMYWEYAGTSIDNIVSCAESALRVFDYEVFDDENVRLRSFEKDGKVTIGISPVNSSLNYINDIKETYADTEILGQPCTINEIFCFDGFTSHMGAAIYYCTDVGIYVKYYATELTPGVWFTEQDYQAYAVDYYNYLISPENNYDEDGNLVGGNRMSFSTYIDSINTKEHVEDNKMKSVEKLIIVILGTIVIISCTILIVSKKKRGHKLADNFAAINHKI